MRQTNTNAFLERAIALFLSSFMLMFFLSACGGSGVATEQQLAEVASLQAEVTSLQAKLDSLQASHDELEAQNIALEAKVKDAEPWFALSELEKEAEKERIAAEVAAKEEARIAAETAAKEEARIAAEAAAAETAEKEKQGYETGITYDQLSRTPDDYDGEKVKFYGRVVQVTEGDGETQIRVSTDGDYDDVVLAYYPSDLLSSRLLEDDYIMFYGVSQGLYTYESTMGGEITVPLISIDKVDQ